MGDDGGGMGPVDLGARLDVAFQVVGVQLDQAGHHQIAVAVDRARRHCRACGDVRDQAIDEAQAAAQDFARQDQRGIGKNRVGRHDVLSCGRHVRGV